MADKHDHVVHCVSASFKWLTDTLVGKLESVTADICAHHYFNGRDLVLPCCAALLCILIICPRHHWIQQLCPKESLYTSKNNNNNKLLKKMQKAFLKIRAKCWPSCGERDQVQKNEPFTGVLKYILIITSSSLPQ